MSGLAVAYRPGWDGPAIHWAMAEGFGKVRVRRGGRFYIDFGRYGRVYSAHGTRFVERKQADAILSLIQVRVAEGVPLARAVEPWLPKSSDAHSVGRWLGLWLVRMRELAESGERAPLYVRHCERLCGTGDHAYIASWWKRRSVHDIDYAGLEEWARSLAAAGLGPKSRQNVLGVFRAFLGWLVRTGTIQTVPPFPTVKVPEHAPRLLSAEDQDRVLRAIPEPRRGIYLALALLGLRPSEAMRLRAADYEAGDPGWLTVERTKSGKVKRLPVPYALEAWIERHVPREARLAGAPLFAGPRGGVWSATSLRTQWSRACAAAGVQRVKLYEGTKHSRATDLLRQGVPERVIQALLGHDDARSTRRYARLADSALVAVIRPRGE